MVSGVHKLDVLTRILEVEPFDAMIVFARTKVATEDLAQRLAARGFAAAPLNGDIVQAQRERTIARLKKGEIDILVATDVAARGLDVDRISHVLNFDIPIDIESYVHRIGRTGRAGRSGEAILFVTHRERHLLRAIERATRQSIEPMAAPSVTDVNAQRIARFKERISTALAAPELDTFFARWSSSTPTRTTCSGQSRSPPPWQSWPRARPPLLEPETQREPERAADRRAPANRKPDKVRRLPIDAPAARRGGAPPKPETRAERRTAPDTPRVKRRERPDDVEMVRYRVAVGRSHGVKAGNLVGAIANETGLDSEFIGRIDIHDEHSFVDLPVGMPRELVRHMRKVWVAGQRLGLTAVEDVAPGTGKRKRPSPKPGSSPTARPHSPAAPRKRRREEKPARPPRRR
jgi:ATP-dependent RNA helicase DeaD